MFRHRPAMKFSVPFIGGIIIGWLYDIPILLPFISSLFLFLLLLVFSLLKWFKWNHLILIILIVNVGLLKIDYDGKISPSDSVARFYNQKRTVRLTGRVIDLPRVTGQTVQFIVDAESLRSRRFAKAVSGGIAVSVRKTAFAKRFFDSLSLGREVRLVGNLTAAGSARNPGDFDIGRYYHLNNIEGKLNVRIFDSSSIGEPASAGDFIARFVYPVRKSASERIDRFIGGEEGNFLKGLLLGERSDIPPDVKTAFINAGVMHIIAVSGLHVAIVTMILLVLFQFLRIPEKPRIVVTLLFLVYYNYLTGGAASVTRSVIMGIVFLSARLFQRKSDIYNTMGLSALIILLADAKQLFQPGFQLSFVAVFALVYLYPKVSRGMEYLPERLRSNPAVKWTGSALSVSVAAGIGTLPFTSYYFGKISIVSFVANMVDVPLSNFILAIGMLAIGVSYLWAWLGGVYAGATGFLTYLLLKSVAIFGSSPAAYVDSHFSVGTSIVFYCCVGIVINLHRVVVRRIILPAGCAALCFWVYSPYVIPQKQPVLKVIVMDVGQGDAIVVKLPDGSTMVEDAGPRSVSLDAGARFVVPYLKREGIGAAQRVVVSHPHSDHLGGIPALLRSLKVDEIMEAGSDGGSALDSEYHHLVDSLKIRHSDVSAGCIQGKGDNWRTYVLHPGGIYLPGKGPAHRNLNNESVVMKLCYGTTSILLAGDAEEVSERQMGRIYGDFLRAGVLKVAHHGSRTGTSDRFLSFIRPSIALISVGAYNRLHHPSPLVLARLDSIGCKWYRTDKCGAIVLESDGREWTVVEWK
jgi:competence protein ComEC